MSDLSINTNPDSEIFQNKYEYPPWYNKKKFIFYNKMLARLSKLSYIHTRSSQYYDKMNYYIFGPSISLTAISGIASFLSTSQFIDSDTQNAFGVAVGVIASISSVMQSIAGACQFSAKKEGHRSAAEQYNNLIVKTKFEIEMPNEENFADDLEKMILDIQGKCNFFPPQFIVNEYDAKNLKNQTKQVPKSISDTQRNKPEKRFSSKKNYNTFHEGVDINSFSLGNTHEDVVTSTQQDVVNSSQQAFDNSSQQVITSSQQAINSSQQAFDNSSQQAVTSSQQAVVNNTHPDHLTLSINSVEEDTSAFDDASETVDLETDPTAILPSINNDSNV